MSPQYSRRRAWAIVVMLFFLLIINFADKAILGLAAEPIMRDLDLDASQFGLLGSAFFLVFGIAAVAGGFIGDRVQSRWLLFGMALLWSVSLAPMMGMVSFAVLFACRVLLGFGEGPIVPIAQHAAHKWFDNKNRNLVTGIIQSGATVGVVVGSPLLTWLIVSRSWHFAFGFMFVIGLVWAVVWLIVGREGPADVRALDSSMPKAAEASPSGPVVPYRTIFRSGTWIACVIGFFVVQWVVGVLTTWLPSYLSDLDYNAGQVGLLNTLPWIVMGVLFVVQPLLSRRLLARGLSSRASRGLVAATFLLISGLCMVVFPLTGGIAQLALITVAFSFCQVMAVVGPAVISEITPTSRRAGALGLCVGPGSFGAVFSPAVTGWLVDRADNPVDGFRLAFLLTAGFVFLAAILIAWLVRPERDRRIIESEARPAPTA
ncbi:MFS transporter [Gordonia McavH-238-E]|uniref:MFS transporter n=1 Tax=Gordonia sp. McavH-238-E TaxID=2917736 RepID=UPI001EF53296|nr:MFS transporter [Gordonia sp. McavH-238-E]MCG7632937.1 MFS transporter [Gordonia sp. McavH-238-E]